MCVIRFCEKIFRLFIALMLFLTDFLVISVLIIPMSIFQFFLKRFSLFVCPNLNKLLTPKENNFVSDLFSPNSPRSSIVAQLVISGHIYVNDVRKLGQQSLALRSDNGHGNILYPEFRQCIKKWCGYYFWKYDSSFEIANHIRNYSQCGTDNKIVTSEDIRDIMEYLLNQKFPADKSPWDVCVINNYIDEEFYHCSYSRTAPSYKTLIFIRFHPTLCNGYEFFQSMLKGHSCSISTVPVVQFSKHKTRDFLQFILTFPFLVMSQVANLYLSCLSSHPWKIPDSKKIWKQNYSRSVEIPVHIFREIRNEFNVTFSSIILSAISTSLTKIMKRKGKCDSNVNDGSLLLNSSSTFRHYSNLKQFSDATQRLFECDDRLRIANKNSITSMLAHYVIKAVGQFPLVILPTLINNRSIVGRLSCLHVECSGNKLLMASSNKVHAFDIISGACPGDAGLSISTVTYGKYVQIGCAVEAAILSRQEVDYLVQLIMDEIDELYRIVLNSRKSKSIFIDLTNNIVPTLEEPLLVRVV